MHLPHNQLSPLSCADPPHIHLPPPIQSGSFTFNGHSQQGKSFSVSGPSCSHTLTSDRNSLCITTSTTILAELSPGSDPGFSQSPIFYVAYGHWDLFYNFVHRILFCFICHLGLFRALSSSFVLKGALIFFSQRDSLLFSSTPQLQLRDSGFSLVSPLHLTFCCWLIIVLLQTNPIPRVTDIHARELPLTFTGHYSPLLSFCFEWEMTPFSGNTLQVM